MPRSTDPHQLLRSLRECDFAADFHDEHAVHGNLLHLHMMEQWCCRRRNSIASGALNTPLVLYLASNDCKFFLDVGDGKLRACDGSVTS